MSAWHHPLPHALFALGLAVVAGCGVAAPGPGAMRPAGVTAAMQERDATSVRAIKKAIKAQLEFSTIDRIVAVKTLALVPAPAWNEFSFEGTMTEDDLDVGYFTFHIQGTYDAVGKTLELKAKDLVSFTEPDPRAPRGPGR